MECAYYFEFCRKRQYAHVTRDPGMADPVTRREYRRAVRIAEAVLR